MGINVHVFLALALDKDVSFKVQQLYPHSKEHPFVAHFPRLYCNATLDSIEVLGSTHT
jgi:hypothetical protein